MTKKTDDPDVRKVRSEREVMRFYWIRVFPYLASIPTTLFALLWFVTDLDLDETIAVISILMVSLLFPIRYKLDGIKKSSFQLDSVSFDEASMSISHKKNSWNRHTWVLEIPFNEIAILRYNKDQYEVVRRDGSIVQLYSDGFVEERYHQIGKLLAAFIEADTGVGIPIRPHGNRSGGRWYGTYPIKKMKEDHDITLTVLSTLNVLGTFAGVGFFLIGGLIMIDYLMSRTFHLSDAGCAAVPILILILIIWKCQSVITKAHTSRKTHGDRLVKAYLDHYSILVSRPNLAPWRTTTTASTTDRDLSLSQDAPAPTFRYPIWKELPPYLDPSLTDILKQTVLYIALLFFFATMLPVLFILNEILGPRLGVSELSVAFGIGIPIVLIMMFKGMAYFEGEFTWIIHRWSMKGGLSEIEQAIEDRYWGRRAKISDGGGGENEMNGAEGDENKIEELGECDGRCES